MKWSHYLQLMACLVGCCAATQADEDVLMFGLKIERDDYIGGRVSSTLKLGRTVTIDLGAREGIRPTNRLWIFRRINGQFRKVGRVEIASTLQQSSVAITENLVRARPRDLVVIPAKELDVWHGQDPLKRRIKNRIVEHQISNRYSTFEREHFGRPLLQQLAANRDIKHATRRYKFLRHRPRGPAYFDISILKSMSRQRVDRRPTQFHPDRLAARDPQRVFDVSTGEFIGFPLEVYDPNPEETGNADPTQPPPTTSDAPPITDVPDLRSGMFEYQRLRAFLSQQD